MKPLPLATRTNQRLLAILVAFCLFSNLGGMAAYLLSVHDLITQENRLHAKATGELFRDEIDRRLENRAHLVRIMAEVPDFALYLLQRQESRLYLAEAYLDYYADSVADSVCYLLDNDGAVVAASNRYAQDSFVGKNEAASPYFQMAKQGTPGIYMGSLYGNGKRGVYLSHPVVGEGTILGVAVIRYPVSIFEDRFAKVKGIMTLLDPAGNVFATNQPGLLGGPLGIEPTTPRQVFGWLSSWRDDAYSASQHAEWFTARQDGRRYVGVRFALRHLEGWRLVYLHDVSNIGQEVVRGLATPTGYALMTMLLLISGGTVLLYRKARQESRQRVVAEQEVFEANAILNQIFNAAADGIRITDKDFTIVQANRTFANMLGREIDEIVGRKCYDIFPGIHCGTQECPKVQIMEGGRDRVVQDVIKRDVRGREFTCSVVSVPFWDAKGTVVGVLESARDISDRVATEQELERAFAEAHQLAEEVAASRDVVQRQKVELEKAYHNLQESQAHLLQREKMASIGQLAAGVAHEINNPMGFISSNLGTMSKYMERVGEFIAAQEKAVTGCCGDETVVGEIADQRKKLKIDYILNDVGNLVRESLDGAERVRKIVQGLKSFSRVDQAEIQAADINECLESTINIVWNELKYKAEVKREYGELPKTVCNPQQLNQVFMNLLVNAAQAIEKKGTITVKTWADAGWLNVTVRDTGSGISKEKLPRIFEPFYTTKEVGKGTGLGLSIAYDIVVKNHKGTIEVQSEEGVGTLFTVKIPLVADGNVSR